MRPPRKAPPKPRAGSPAKPAPKAESTRAPEPVRAPGRRLFVLVDDEPDTLHSLKEFVEAKFDARALLAHDAESALRILSTTRPDLLIVDQRLPKMQGRELAAEARRLHPTLHVVIVTGQPQQAAALADTERDGRTHVFMKPITTAPFVERLREILK